MSSKSVNRQITKAATFEYLILDEFDVKARSGCRTDDYGESAQIRLRKILYRLGERGMCAVSLRRLIHYATPRIRS